MTNGMNWNFQNNTQNFLRQTLITAVRLPPLHAGNAIFDLAHHNVGGQNVVTLDAYNLLGGGGVGWEAPLMAYWVPQGGSCVVPAAPGGRRLVFTPDFSGCAILVDQLNAGNYRVYHVQGGAGHLNNEYLNPIHNHGLGLAGAMTFDDYGTAAQPRGFAFLKFEAGRWWIYQQRQTGVGLGWVGGQLVPIGPQSPRGGAKVPVANLTQEVPRLNATQNGIDLPITRNIRAQTRMMPNDEIW
ncbi:MAG: hypothetical protein ACP5M1_12820 [Acidiphilium sp.]